MNNNNMNNNNMKINVLSVLNPVSNDAGKSFNNHSDDFGCKPKYAFVNGMPKFNVYEVVDKEKFFSGVEKYGITYEEVDWELKDFSQNV